MFEWPIYAYFRILKKSFPETSTTTLPETNIITFNTGVKKNELVSFGEGLLPGVKY